MKVKECLIQAKKEKRFHRSGMLDKLFKLFPREFLNSQKDGVKIVEQKNWVDLQSCL